MMAKNPFRYGDGGEDNPYIIETAEDFLKIEEVSKSNVYQYFLQGNDIDMAEKKHIPIGGNNGPPFCGEFNGGCFEIKNFKCDDGGLFNMVARGRMCNINIPGAVVKGQGDSTVGIISGNINNGDIEFFNCHVSGHVSGGGYCGMLSGRCGYASTFEKCTATGDVISNYDAGGFFSRGSSGEVRIKDCYFNGTLTTTGDGMGDAGGFLAATYDKVFIENSFVEADITCGSTAGGLVGRANDSEIKDCYFKGSLKCEYYAGGLVGDCRRSIILTSYAKADLEASGSYAGGIVASGVDCEIRDCFFVGKVKSEENFVGGFIGRSERNKIVGCYALLLDKATGKGHAGGFVGQSNSDNYANCFCIGGARAIETNGDGGGAFAGGFAGYIDDGIMNGCFSIGDSWADDAFSGGFSASLNGSSQISNCYSNGSVIAETWAGGFVGQASYSGGCFMSSCTSAGTVSGRDFVAGFVNSSNYIYLDCYSLVDSVTLLPGRNGIWSGDFVDMAYGSYPSANYSRAYRYSGTNYNQEGTQYFELRGIPTDDRPVDPEGFALDEFLIEIIREKCELRTRAKCERKHVTKLMGGYKNEFQKTNIDGERRTSDSA